MDKNQTMNTKIKVYQPCVRSIYIIVKLGVLRQHKRKIDAFHLLGLALTLYIKTNTTWHTF